MNPIATGAIAAAPFAIGGALVGHGMAVKRQEQRRKALRAALLGLAASGAAVAGGVALANRQIRKQEALDKEAQDAPVTALTPEERLRRKENMRKLIGAIAGLEYGFVGGGTMGGELLGSKPGKFDKKMALRGALIGAPIGSLSGYLGGALLNKIKRYTQEDHAPAPQIHIVTRPSAELIHTVQESMKQGSAVALTLGMFSGMAKLAYGAVPNLPGQPAAGGSLDKTPARTEQLGKPSAEPLVDTQNQPPQIKNQSYLKGLKLAPKKPAAR